MSPIIQDPWEEEKIYVERFYKKVFSFNINWKDFVLPKKKEKFSHLNVLPAECQDADCILSAINTCKSFDFRLRNYHDLNMLIATHSVRQIRPKGNYAWADTGQHAPDECHLGKSYNAATSEKFTFMDELEYIISSAEFEFRTGSIYDEKTITRLSVLNKNEKGIAALFTEGRGFCFIDIKPSYHTKLSGPREIVIR